MTLAADPWPAYAEHTAPRSRSGVLTVWRLELAKLSSLWRVRALVLGCLAGPFVIVAGLNLQSATPGDTAFGQWVHTSGFAIPMVILGFGSQWLLPVGTAVVAGDIFSAEDHFGTWKTILTRSRSRGELFAGKFLAALTFATAGLVLLVLTNLLAGLLAGTQPVVGLGGQLVPAGRAAELELVSWLSVLPPVLAFTALAMLVSVVSRNSVVGIGVPVALILVFQVVTLVALPAWGQQVLLSTPFLAWHGFWEQPAFVGPFLWGLVTCAVWFGLCGVGAWLVFRRRTIGGGGMIARIPGRRNTRGRAGAVAMAAGLLALTVSGCGSTGLTAPRLQTSLSSTFANLYVLQQTEQGNPKPSAASLESHTSCQKGGTLDVPQDGSGLWLCQLTYLVAGPGYPVIAKYNVDVQTDGCYAADGDGPASVNGSPTLTGPHYTQLINPLSLIDGCFDTT